jgi:hypothetical protein
LAARKRLLLLESELNRTRLVEAVDEWKDEFERSKQQLASLGSLASLAGKVARFVPAIGGFFSPRPSAEKKRKVPFLLNSLMTGTSVWLFLRSLRRRS